MSWGWLLQVGVVSVGRELTVGTGRLGKRMTASKGGSESEVGLYILDRVGGGGLALVVKPPERVQDRRIVFFFFFFFFRFGSLISQFGDQGRWFSLGLRSVCW